MQVTTVKASRLKAADTLKRINEQLSFYGKSRPWLSERTGIPLSTVNSWYARGGRFPRADDAAKVAEALHASLEYLVGGTEWHLLLDGKVLGKTWMKLWKKIQEECSTDEELIGVNHTLIKITKLLPKLIPVFATEDARIVTHGSRELISVFRTSLEAFTDYWAKEGLLTESLKEFNDLSVGAMQKLIKDEDFTFDKTVTLLKFVRAIGEKVAGPIDDLSIDFDQLVIKDQELHPEDYQQAEAVGTEIEK